MERRVAELRRIVRRDRGRHPDRDALRAVGEQIGERARQHHRLVLGAVVGRPEVDGILVDAVDQEMRDLGQPRFGVTHGGGVIAVHIAEISLPVDQRIALGEVLRETHERVVDRLVAVRMELADDVADHARAFLERRARVEPQLPHRIEEPAVHRLEPVARIRQGAPRDGGERVLEIALLERVPQRNLFDLAVARTNQLLAHEPRVTARWATDKSGARHPQGCAWPLRIKLALGRAEAARRQAASGSRRPHHDPGRTTARCPP